MDCRPGPPTVLTKSEEDEIVQYLIQMADMGYGLTREARSTLCTCIWYMYT